MPDRKDESVNAASSRPRDCHRIRSSTTLQNRNLLLPAAHVLDTDQRVFHVLSDRKGLQLVNAQVAMKTLGMTNLNGMKTSCGFAYKLNYAVCTWSRGLHNRQFATLQWLPKSMVHVRSIIEIDSVTVHNSWLVNAKDKNWKPSGYGNRVVTETI